MVYLHSDPALHRWWWDAAYPMPWRSIVDAHRGDLPRGLVYATMRQESGFQAGVNSRAGAVGLMQVMPEVATKLAGRRVTRSELRSPEVNIELGLQEMKALADDLDRVYPLSIAAYNAGKSRVRRSGCTVLAGIKDRQLSENSRKPGGGLSDHGGLRQSYHRSPGCTGSKARGICARSH